MGVESGPQGLHDMPTEALIEMEESLFKTFGDSDIEERNRKLRDLNSISIELYERDKSNDPIAKEYFEKNRGKSDKPPFVIGQEPYEWMESNPENETDNKGKES